MAKPTNDAGRIIVSAQSVITDLMTQKKQLQEAIDRQQAMIETLLPMATWDIPEEPAQPEDSGEPEQPTEE